MLHGLIMQTYVATKTELTGTAGRKHGPAPKGAPTCSKRHSDTRSVPFSQVLEAEGEEVTGTCYRKLPCDSTVWTSTFEAKVKDYVTEAKAASGTQLGPGKPSRVYPCFTFHCFTFLQALGPSN